MTEQHRCTHCAATQTPLWRSGPNGPKSLCNACGMRWKKGKLLPLDASEHAMPLPAPVQQRTPSSSAGGSKPRPTPVKRSPKDSPKGSPRMSPKSSPKPRHVIQKPHASPPSSAAARFKKLSWPLSNGSTLSENLAAGTSLSAGGSRSAAFSMVSPSASSLSLAGSDSTLPAAMHHFSLSGVASAPSPSSPTSPAAESQQQERPFSLPARLGTAGTAPAQASFAHMAGGANLVSSGIDDLLIVSQRRAESALHTSQSDAQLVLDAFEDIHISRGLSFQPGLILDLDTSRSGDEPKLSRALSFATDVTGSGSTMELSVRHGLLQHGEWDEKRLDAELGEAVDRCRLLEFDSCRLPGMGSVSALSFEFDVAVNELSEGLGSDSNGSRVRSAVHTLGKHGDAAGSEGTTHLLDPVESIFVFGDPSAIAVGDMVQSTRGCAMESGSAESTALKVHAPEWLRNPL
ncbi:GATA transcription factor 12 [Porphyridium purpureum]|uniref:GATA transcription factor 12 n=1 Tax=Porphyridium purpureum TaxID=35688 RepID=A0A5J4YLV7_PORPP|nr:GATA transcription factor 12 [Porphyridium purpureum]|eukprot:POR6488..scf295_9